MAYKAHILADSISPDGIRLTTFEAWYPRIILAEVDTHRVMSRNSASSRAIPLETQIKELLSDPVLPVVWGTNQSGMTAGGELSTDEIKVAKHNQLLTRDLAILGMVAQNGGLKNIKDDELRAKLQKMKTKYNVPFVDLETPLHKQHINRPLEAWMWTKTIISATEWSNFFALRTDANAQPEFRTIAVMMKEAMDKSTPKKLDYDQWHLPLAFLQEEDYELYEKDPEKMKMVAAGRCARVSYMTHDGKRDPEKDIELYNQLVSNGHLSPLEHIARPQTPEELKKGPNSNFRGWHQHRKDIKFENDFGLKHKADK